MSAPTPPVPSSPPTAATSAAQIGDVQLTPIQNIVSILHEELSEAADEAEFVATIGRYAERHRPSALRLLYIHYNEQLVPVEAQTVAHWQPQGKSLAPGTPTRFPLEQFELIKLAMSHPEQAYVIPDIAAEPRLSDREKQLCAAAGHVTSISLPCYSKNSRTWQAVLFLLWPAVHTPSAEELFIYNRIARMLTAFIANRRAMLAHKETLLELRLIDEVSVRVNDAQSLEQALQALINPFIERGASSAVWSTMSVLLDGEPEEAEIIAAWQRRPGLQSDLSGQRFSVPAIPLWKRWTTETDNLLLVSDIHTDERVDEKSRSLLAARQRAAVIMMPLRSRGRWVGAITIAWDVPQAFTSRDRALCRFMANQAAIVFDNRQLLGRMQDALREHQRQSLALKALLDNMPVGVSVVDALSGKPQIVNPKALQILGSELSTVASQDDFAKVFQRHVAGEVKPLTWEDLPLGRTLADGQSHHSEVEIVRPDGGHVFLDVFSAPILDESGVMRSAMSLFVDISERKRAESERFHIHEELIAIQAAALAERSTPLIPISDEIMVLPLIGSLDTERGQQILDVLLNGVSQTQTRVAIIDVTGVRTLDTQAAQTLTQSAHALRLLGVEPVLTGIRAEVAQTLVSLGVPLQGITTRSTLQSGIAYANRKKRR